MVRRQGRTGGQGDDGLIVGTGDGDSDIVASHTTGSQEGQFGKEGAFLMKGNHTGLCLDVRDGQLEHKLIQIERADKVRCFSRSQQAKVRPQAAREGLSLELYRLLAGNGHIERHIFERRVSQSEELKGRRSLRQILFV